MTVMSTQSKIPTTGSSSGAVSDSPVYDWRVSYSLPSFSKPFSFRVSAPDIGSAYRLAIKDSSVVPTPDCIVSIERPISPDVETCKRLVRDILCGRVPLE